MLGRISVEDLSAGHISVIALSFVTGLIHFYLGFQIGLTETLGLSFLIAGIGFLLLILGVATGFRPDLTYILGIVFTGGQIVLWYRVNQPEIVTMLTEGRPMLDLIDKTSQTLLIMLLVYLYRGRTDLDEN